MEKCEDCIICMTQLEDSYGCYCAMESESGSTDTYVFDFSYCPVCGNKNGVKNEKDM